MTPEQARQTFDTLLMPDSEPQLSAQELDVLWALVPFDATSGDTTLVDVHLAVGYGWLSKSGKVAGLFDAAPGSGLDFKRQQMHEMCVRMASIYGVAGVKDYGPGKGPGAAAAPPAQPSRALGSVGVYIPHDVAVEDA